MTDGQLVGVVVVVVFAAVVLYICNRALRADRQKWDRRR